MLFLSKKKNMTTVKNMLDFIQPTINLKYLVTGTGRCGTTYMARLLTSLGIMCGHESIFNPGGLAAAENKIYFGDKIETSLVSTKNIIVDQPYEIWFDPKLIKAECSYMAAPFLAEKFLENTKIIHIVRNPFHVLSSFLYDLNFFDFQQLDIYKNYVLKHLPDIKNVKTNIERACYYYICWNQMIEKIKYTKPYFFHKVENKCTKELCNFLEVEHFDNYFSDSNINSWKRDRKKTLSLADIPEGPIKKDFIETICRYGYKEILFF